MRILNFFKTTLVPYLRQAKQIFLRLSGKQKIIAVSAFIAAVPVAGLLSLFFFTWIGLFGPLPSKNELVKINHQVATEVYSADSVLLGRYYIIERSNVQSEDIPEVVRQALIATEDVRFYEHGGVDFQSLGRVFIKSILLQSNSAGGGSTITQQLAKNLYPRRSYLLFSLPINKIREAITAWRLESVYSKEELLTLYLNTIPFGENAFGIQSASLRFFSSPVQKLKPEQAALLIGMLKATYLYNPRLFPDRAKLRRNVVLAQMKKYDFLTTNACDSLQLLPVKLDYKRITHHTGLAPYFRDFVKQELLKWCRENQKPDGEPYNLYSDGLRIYTTIDSRLQTYAEKAMEQQMKFLQDQFAKHWGKQDPWEENKSVLEEAVRHSSRYRSLMAKGLSEEEIIQEMKMPATTSVFTWTGEQEVKMSSYDSIRHHLKFLQAGLLAMDPNNGSVKAWVGGINHQFFQFDHVRESTKRQVGSTIKPIIYAAALEQGLRPCDFTSAERIVYTNLEDWSPENTANETYDLKYSMEGALTNSVNTVSVRLLEKAGISNAVNLAKDMGIRSTLPEVPSLALGSPSISMIEMVSAYGSFVNDGYAVTPFFITSITDHDGNELDRFKEPADAEQVLSSETSQLMIQMMKRVVNEGTGASLRWKYGIQNDVAGKTGTTQSNADGWFIAVTPKLVIGTWVGADDPRIRFRSTSLGQGAATALPIFAKLMQQVNADPELKVIANAKFPPLSPHLERRLDCDLSKADMTFFERIFGKEKTTNQRNFNNKKAKKESFFKRLFGKGSDN